MDGVKLEETDYTNHDRKCRICFKAFGADEHRVEISKLIEKKFRELTQTILKISEEYSREICVVCNFQLKDFCVFKKNVILLQKGLYKFVANSPAPAPDNFGTNNGNPTTVKTELEDFYQETDYHPNDGEIEVKSEFLDFSGVMNFDPSPHEFKGNNSDHDYENISRLTVGKYECSECDIKLANQYLLDRHFKRDHLEENLFICDYCPFKSDHKHSLRKHMNNHGERTLGFPCDLCNFVSNSKCLLQSHHNKDHALFENRFECNECLSTFESYQSFHNHKLKMHSSDRDKSKWVCQYCNTSFSGSRTLRDHITIMHSSIKPQIPCAVKSCSKVFLTTKRLRAHMKVHDDDAKEMCPECGLLLTSKHNLEKHIKRVHLKLRNFFCDICGYSATFRHSIASHMVSHIDPNERRKWNCDLCSFVSVSKQSLRAHKSYEHSGKVYTCHCGKQFNQRASLSTHIKCVHHKIKDHLCNLCGKAYFTRKDLQNHKKSQHMEKDMPCEICGKLFATQKHLTRHRMYHDEPKYKCTFEGCCKAFIDNAKLKDHVKLHEGNRDHLCHLCEKSYFHQKDLKRHLDVAHKATIFYCEICSFTISRKDYLRNHLNSAHKHLSLEEKNEILARTKVERNVV